MNAIEDISDPLDLSSFLSGSMCDDLNNDIASAAEEKLPPPSPKELTDEIKSFRQKAKEFQATNDHETYLIIVFSCKADKNEFLKSAKIEKAHTLVDGYELARNMKINPIRPSLKLKEPLSI